MSYLDRIFFTSAAVLISAGASFSGAYCGGSSPKTIGRSLDPYDYCKSLYGTQSTAIATRADALGWVCRTAGKPDQPLNMNAVCKYSYGSTAIAALRGIHSSDWKCIVPSEVEATIVPVLLYPKELVNADAVAFVKSRIANLKQLMAGIQSFYQGKADRMMDVSVPFVALTTTTAQGWQDLANATQDPVPGYPEDRYGLFYRGVEELKANGWNTITSNSSARVGGFPSLGNNFTEAPSKYGAAASGKYFIEPPNVSPATCTVSQPNPASYEGAFYATGHELGHTLSLIHTNNYNVSLPANWRQSMMYNGRGTASVLFDFEIARLQQFLDTW